MSNTGTAVAAPAPTPYTTHDGLYTLYVENNSSNAQLLRLLDNNNKHKLVFQIYRDAAGYMRLLVIPAMNGNGRYFLADTIQPKLSAIQQETFPANNDVTLGDLQLSNQSAAGNPLTLLRNNIGNPTNDSEWRFIWFVPEIIPVPDGQTPPSSAFVKDYLTYRIVHSDRLPAIMPDAILKGKLGVRNETELVSIKPSPPRRME